MQVQDHDSFVAVCTAHAAARSQSELFASQTTVTIVHARLLKVWSDTDAPPIPLVLVCCGCDAVSGLLTVRHLCWVAYGLPRRHSREPCRLIVVEVQAVQRCADHDIGCIMRER